MRVSRADEAADHDPARRARFDEIVAIHVPSLEVVARRLCRQRSRAADLLQDTLERAWRRLDSLESTECARAWLTRIMRNAWLDQLRRPQLEVPLDEVAEPAAERADEPSRWEQVTVDDVRQAIEQLDEPFRSVAILHDVDGMSYSEIAARLDIRYATAATRLHRARRQIRAHLKSKLDRSPP